MAEHEPRGLSGIGESAYEEVELSAGLAWLRTRIERFVRGGIYLIAGQPGIGKSTLGIQIALDLGRRGERSLYILTEQSKEDLAQRARRMSADWSPKQATAALALIEPEESIYDIENLPSFLSHQVLNPSGKYHGIKFVVVDSIQGHGLAAAATKKYRQVYEFCRQCKSAGITVLLVAHVTKKGEIAGPKDLEHNVDCVLVMRKAMVYRPLFVPKNRFGPAVLKPVPLEMDRVTTALKISPHTDSVSSVARTYLGRQTGVAEAQAAVSLPQYGSRGRITAPGLPKREIEQLTTCISQIPEMEIEDLDYTIQCRLPGERNYRRMLGLPLCLALIASYIQKDIPAYHIYLGEVDLLRRVRGVPDDVLTEFCEDFQEGKLGTPVKLFCPPESASLLRDLIPKGATIVSCDRLDDAVFSTWPEIRGNTPAAKETRK
ncbi:MAG TPA: ATPase domain-containing protein [Thermoanaerobaculia bacterium]|nr:ATPase domain-containing protein [Thermoanaerobaculia bacterium]HQR66994.1 ATPase domain-containing protein [Thermoanaerobaculia bacterium]